MNPEGRFEAALEPHREPDGTFACDAHVLLAYAREALACSALEPSMEERIELGARARWAEQNPTVPWEEAGLTMQALSRASTRTVLEAAGVPRLLKERDAVRDGLDAAMERAAERYGTCAHSKHHSDCPSCAAHETRLAIHEALAQVLDES